MGNENEKHAAPTQMAEMNAAVSAAVQEAVKGIFAQLGPILQNSASLTPENLAAAIREGNKPQVDPAKLARELRETMNSKEQEAEIRKADLWRKANCPHQDRNGNDSICPIRNYPDGQSRGVCMICQDLITPKEWVIDAPDPKTGKSVARMRAAHKDYHRVLRIISMA